MKSAVGLRKTPYEQPQLRKPNPEQVLLFLLGHSWDGDQPAKEVLDLIYRDRSQRNLASKSI
jgi:hypothetical protein